MKISKKSVLLAMSGMLTIASLCFMLVFAENSIDLNVDPNNAIQHFKNIKIISTNINNETYAIINKIGNLIGIETDYNFVLTKSGSNEKNSIKNAITGSSILGGTENSIENGTHNEILGGKENRIEGGKNNGILGGITNKKGNGNHSVIFGGKNNEITGSYSSIVGGEGNKVTKSRAMAIGNNNTTNGYNSVAMGSGSTLSGQNSFLWTDGNSSEEILEQINVFAIKGKNGVVVNTSKAHNLAQLTVSGSLIVYDNKKVLECTDDTKGVLKVIDGDVYNNNQKCFCSCDGSGRNALHEGTRCEALCNNEAGLQAECGTVEAICGTTPYSYTGAGTSGACIVGELVEGTGAFLINTQSDNTEWIHRSCQTAYGQVTGCMQQLTGASCPNLRTGYECIWDHEELTGHLITNPNPPVDSATFWKYDPELKGPCSYICDQYGEWDPIQGECIFHECRGELPEGAKLNDEMALPMNDTTDYFYSDTSTGACSYKCNAEYGYYYSGTLNKCVTCPEGQAYDESDGTCKVACDMSNTSFGTITIMDESGYAITIADRNLGATSNNTGEVSSYGCYFQWGNNYGFQPQGNLETSTDFVDTSAYGPSNPYSSGIFRVRSGVINDENGLPIYGPNDDDWSNPVNDNLWGGAYDSGNNAFGVLDPDKENRRGPCPAGYHVPSIGERNDLLTLWYNKEYKSDGVEASQYIKDTGKITNFNFEGNFGLGSIESTKLVKAFRDYFKLPSAGNREFIEIIPSANYGKGGSFWTSSSPWLYNSFSAGSLATNNRINSYPNNANSFGYNIENQGGYVGASTDGRKMSAQSVRCFKDVPECPSGSIWNQSELRCETSKQCDVEHTVIQDLELFIISSTGEISHYTMMDRNLGAFEVYNQKGENEQNARSLGCHFQWGNNYGFTPGTQSTRYGINPTNYSPSSYSNSKIYCKNRNGNTGNEQENDRDLNEQGNIFGSQYTPIDYHLRGGGYISFNRIFERGYGSDGTDIDRRGPCPEGYHVPRGIEMDDLVNNWNNASISQGAIGKNFASDLLMPYGRYIEVYCGEQNKFKVGGGIWLSDHIYKYYTGDKTGGHYMNHIAKFTDNSTISFSKNGLAHGFPVRCVKNNMATTPQKVTIHPDGGTGAVIGIDWESEGSGKITALGTPTKNGINFLGWYSNLSFADEFKVNTGDYISNSGHLYARWDGCNIVDTAIQDLEVFFLSSPSRISHYVMMDRNLGATETFNQDISSPNESSYGCYFQWGNNYPFNRGRSGASYITGTLRNTKDYGPNTVNGYYSNSMRHCREPNGQSGYVMYPVDNSNYPYATWLWGGGATSDGINYTRAGWGSGGSDIDRQGPCPAGYHIPRGIEMENIMQGWKDVSDCPYETGTIALQKAKQFASELLLPFAGFNGIGCPQNEYLGGGTIGNYMISDYIYSNYRNHLHMGRSSAGDGLYLYLNGPSYGYSLRCVKNNISDTPQKVTINAYGGTGAVVAIDWETDENGRIVTLGEPNRDGYNFGGWYSDPLFSSRIYTGDNISKEGNLYAKWIAKDCDITNTTVQDLELFFLSETGDISHYMMMDRNLGATEIYNKNSSSQNKKSFGCFFQWGNNYGFPMEIGNTRSTPIDVSSYGPDNYYINSTLFCNGVEGRMYTGLFTDLWGGITNTDISKKGPCPAGYHIPNLYEINMLINGWKSASAGSGIQFASDILLPFAGAISPNCGSGYKNVGGNFWSSDMSANGRTPHHIFILKSGEIGTTSNGVATGFPLRCVKNNLNSSLKKVTIHSEEGTGAVIAIDWETEESGKIMTLGEPSKSGYSFDGRYSDEGFNNKLSTGDYISKNGHLYAKWTKRIAIFAVGNTFNDRIKTSYYGGSEANIKSIKRSYSKPSGVRTGLLSDTISPIPIIFRYKDGTIYYYTEAEKIYLNENSEKMFDGLYRLTNLDMSGWDTSNVSDTSRMFYGCKGLSNLDLSNFNTSNITNMNSMFYGCNNLSNLNLSGWDTSNVKDMGSMFAGCSNFTTLDLSNFNTSNVTNMNSMFYGCNNLNNLNLSGWNTSNVTDMNSMFRGCSKLSNLELNHFNTSNVINMSSMFQGCSGLNNLNINGWNTTNVINMSSMFNTCSNLTSLNLTHFNTNNVTNMSSMFQGCSKLTNLNLSGWDTSNVTDMSSMFNTCSSLTNLDVTHFKTNNVRNMSSMFNTCSNLTNLDVTHFDTSNVSNMREMFRGCSKLSNLDVTHFNTSNVSNMSSMFYGCNGLSNLDVTHFDTSNVSNMNSMFYGCKGLSNLDVTHFDTSNVSNMGAMFRGCSKLTNLDVTHFDTSNVSNMREMFRGCSKLANIDLSHFDTSKVEDMYEMFMEDSNLTDLDLSNFNTSNVINMSEMFRGCSKLSNLNTNGWDTSNVENMDSMFYGCSSIINLDLKHFNTSHVGSMDGIFRGCSQLSNLDVSNWDTTNNRSLIESFLGCKNLTNLDLSNRDTRNVKYMKGTFSSCTNLKTIYAGPKFRTDNVEVLDSTGMFYNNINLVGGNTTSYDPNFTDKTYARIGTENQPGYFTKTGATDKSIAYLLPGKLFNTTVKSLSIGNTTANKLITKLEKANSLPIGATTITISDTGSDAPIYAWFDNGILYYHTTADIIEANSDLSSMFAGFQNLTEFDFGDWDISNVRNINYMFSNCNSLTKLDLSNLVTDKWNVTNIRNIYNFCYSSCDNLTELSLSGWNLISNYRNEYSSSLRTLLFGGTPPTQLKKLDLSNVKINGGLDKKYEECGNIEEIILDGIDTSQVTNMEGMFNTCTNLSHLDVSHLDTSNVTNMRYMFRHCYNLTGLDLSSWDTSKVTDMTDIFVVGASSKLETIYASTGFTTDQIGNESMFTAKALVGGNGTKYEIITSAYVNMSTTKPNDKTFAKIDNHSQSGYFTNKNEITVRFMIGQGEKYTEQVVKFGDRATMPTINPSKPGATFEKWVTKDGEPYNFNNKIYKYTELYAKFNSEEATLLQGSKFNLILKNLSNPTMDFTDPAGSHVYNIQTLKRWTGDNIPSGVYTGILSAPYSDNEIVAWYNAGIVYYYTVANTIYLNEDSSFMFYGLGGLKDLNLSNWNTDKTNNMNYMFGTCTTLTNLNLNGWDTSNVKDMSYMFYNCNNLTSLDVTHFKTKNTTNMRGMFSKCNNLTRLNLNEWETNNVNDMSYMFNECSSLTGLDLSNFNTNNVTNMSYMFNKGNNLTSLNLNGWNTNKVIDMSYMFNECSNLSGIDVSHFDTSNTTNIAYMFYKCTNLTGLDLNSWNTSNVTNMRGTFYECSNLIELDISNFNTNNVNDMGGMFYGCSNLTELDISSFKTNKVTNMYNMFGTCNKLKTIYASTGFTTNNINSNDTSYMFQNNTSLVGGNGTKFDISHNNKTYARIDQPGIPGYFTLKQ